ncbi:hypothetical protein E6P09_10560 [Haloferax mediterranei ATCC 33500]|uniref:Uncharacterized protein n=1 Tax=Haloferax mediterranei (strain ATCC 33500 / DSM 1411 / JCM 8866 / NBRC 14739 / NCIMB 2177 / R-4) TaxID=523841 RepID=I3R4Q2_HALMT|nr:DUF5798 family protein [Haloferax mediterranei]AFK19212.1 hypothetical protein HFX_1505 [Haloferax mediterranei ATCC 33500]AHZ21425.1 hypothetical protein BM92_01610 [Haloferax mediterranei ATCC 33500]EMA03884.1 hypothetical protein C439_02963 [Haloferax mediterranei ATCC 33500]MDX5989313.1 DUF5798 family protein [Haloferax mediterranei ATCC 33500]QCQ75680.1 hypothetical protein E6P09_10560 [Haloferax mediterranei ATCC 33500]
MALGGTAKKLQKVAEMAEDVYKKLNELREQIVEVRETVNETEARVDRLEAENAEQRAILEAIAEEQGVDLDAAIAQAHISEAEDVQPDSVADSDDASDDADSAGDENASTDQ